MDNLHEKQTVTGKTKKDKEKDRRKEGENTHYYIYKRCLHRAFTI